MSPKLDLIRELCWYLAWNSCESNSSSNDYEANSKNSQIVNLSFEVFKNSYFATNLVAFLEAIIY